jgi:hypothetical protein
MEVPNVFYVSSGKSCAGLGGHNATLAAAAFYLKADRDGRPVEVTTLKKASFRCAEISQSFSAAHAML